MEQYNRLENEKERERKRRELRNLNMKFFMFITVCGIGILCCLGYLYYAIPKLLQQQRSQQYPHQMEQTMREKDQKLLDLIKVNGDRKSENTYCNNHLITCEVNSTSVVFIEQKTMKMIYPSLTTKQIHGKNRYAFYFIFDNEHESGKYVATEIKFHKHDVEILNTVYSDCLLKISRTSPPVSHRHVEKGEYLALMVPTAQGSEMIVERGDGQFTCDIYSIESCEKALDGLIYFLGGGQMIFKPYQNMTITTNGGRHHCERDSIYEINVTNHNKINHDHTEQKISVLVCLIFCFAFLFIVTSMYLLKTHLKTKTD